MKELFLEDILKLVGFRSKDTLKDKDEAETGEEIFSLDP